MSEETRNAAIRQYDRIEADVARMAAVLEDECERLGYDAGDRKLFFDLMWDYAEHAMCRRRGEVVGWPGV